MAWRRVFVVSGGVHKLHHQLRSTSGVKYLHDQHHARLEALNVLQDLMMERPISECQFVVCQKGAPTLQFITCANSWKHYKYPKLFILLYIFFTFPGMVNGSISVCCQMSGFCRSSVVALLAYEDVEEVSLQWKCSKDPSDQPGKPVRMLISKKLHTSERLDWSLWLSFVIFQIDLSDIETYLVLCLENNIQTENRQSWVWNKAFIGSNVSDYHSWINIYTQNPNLAILSLTFQHQNYSWTNQDGTFKQTPFTGETN